MPVLNITVASEARFSVRRFAIREGLSVPFVIQVWALSEDANVDPEGVVGRAATFRAITGYRFAKGGGARYWTGICRYMEQGQPEPSGLSSYFLEIVPAVWLLTKRRNYRLFQHQSIPDIVETILAEWEIEPVMLVDRDRHPKLELRVQYGESDYSFLCRLLEETGIVFTFPDDDKKGSRITFSDQPQVASSREGPTLPYVDNPSESAEMEFVTAVEIARDLRPGALVVRDYDFRNPAFDIRGEAPKSSAPEDRLEQFHYRPGVLLVEGSKGGETPSADDKGAARYSAEFARELATRSLGAAREPARGFSFGTNTIDLWPGVIARIGGHPHAELPDERRCLVIDFTLEGTNDGEWRMSGRATFADIPYRPEAITPRPAIPGVQTARVVGPKMQEIHTDEFGRIRVQFPWDRHGTSNDDSSCWIRVSQEWAGAGYGMEMIPRVGQEVLVGFLGGNPDQPVIVGRLYNQMNTVPYKLPEHKTKSVWKTDSSPGSGGYNEIFFEDKKGDELFSLQAEKNLRALVKNDETITVGNDRQKRVGTNETETTGIDRTEVTGEDRSETTGDTRVTMIGGDRRRLTRRNETLKITDQILSRVGEDWSVAVGQRRRERVESESHLRVKGNRREKVDGSRSTLIRKDRQVKIGGKYALDAGEEIHLAADRLLVAEGADITLKGPGGFVRIDGGGVTIRGKKVDINVAGAPGEGSGAHPETADEPPEPVLGATRTPGGFEVVVVDTDDVPLAGARVRVLQFGSEVFSATLDDEGRTWVTGHQEGFPCDVIVEGHGVLGQHGHIESPAENGDVPEYEAGEAEDTEGCGSDFSPPG